MIYLGKVTYVFPDAVTVETSKKTFRVSLSNIRLTYKDNNFSKSEFFPRETSQASFKAPKDNSYIFPSFPKKDLVEHPKGTLLDQTQNLMSSVNSNQNRSLFPLNMISKSHLLNEDTYKKSKESLSLLSNSNFHKIANFQSVKPKLSLADSSFKDFINSDGKSNKFHLNVSLQSNTFQPPSVQVSALNNMALSLQPRLTNPVRPLVSISKSAIQNNEVDSSNLQFPLTRQTSGNVPINGDLIIANTEPKTELGQVPSETINKNTDLSAAVSINRASNSDLINFSILFKLLKKKKKLTNHYTKLLKNRSETNLDTNEADIQWVQKAISGLDQILKNVWLSLKLKDKSWTGIYFIYFALFFKYLSKQNLVHSASNLKRNNLNYNITH